ncbi:hypothetical protein GBF38_015686 [Nibea albiflora]|uniref:Uncharacterized protein n=1 Tax=Nibea albiflora TaxID=240163 RepID=A0ACB7EN12_NIBAL|nr:hypothetical protein GBF38_015686 [Nibea albiflora]
MRGLTAPCGVFVTTDVLDHREEDEKVSGPVGEEEEQQQEQERKLFNSNVRADTEQRDLPPSPEQMKPEFSCQNNSVRHKQRRVTLCVTMATPPGFPDAVGTKTLWVNIVLGSPSLHFSTSKPNNPADRGIK